MTERLGRNLQVCFVAFLLIQVPVYFLIDFIAASPQHINEGMVENISADQIDLAIRNFENMVADYGSEYDNLLQLKKNRAETKKDAKINEERKLSDNDSLGRKSSGIVSPRTYCECEPLQTDDFSRHTHDVLSKVDPITGMSGRDSLARHHPNLPLQLMDGTPRCRLWPDLFSISWTAVHWQEVGVSSDETYYLYSAFYDNRTKTIPSGGAVRILALLDGNVTTPHLCQLWYDNQTQPVPSVVLSTKFIDYQTRSSERLQPVLLTCAAGSHQMAGAAVPMAVSLVSSPCDKPRNILKVIGKPTSKIPHHQDETQAADKASSSHWRVAVCGPSLFFAYEDYSLRLVEWLELMKELGVSQVFFYTIRGLHPNIEKVLRHYETTGFVELVDFQYPPPYMDEPLLKKTWTQVERNRLFALETIPFTDCVLRYKDRYRFLAHFDPDEVPVLLKHHSLPQLLASVYSSSQKSSPPHQILFHWRYFPLIVVAPDEEFNKTPMDMSTKDTLYKFCSSQNFQRNSTGIDTTDGAAYLPSYLTILRNTRRLLKEYQPKVNFKPIFDSHDATGISSHSATYCAAGGCPKSFTMSPDTAYVGHFRYPCIGDCCKIYANQTLAVPQMSKFRPTVIEKIRLVLETLNLVP